MLTARQIIEKVQRTVVRAVVDGDPVYNEDELLDKVKEFADSQQLHGHRVRRRRRHKAVPLGQRPAEVSLESDSEDVTDIFFDDDLQLSEVAKAMSLELKKDEQTNSVTNTKKFFYTVALVSKGSTFVGRAIS